MSNIAVFHSTLGVRQGVLDIAEILRAAGHEVLVVDQFEGRVFDDYAQAAEYSQSMGYEAYMQSALDSVAGLPDGFICLGFSNGGGVSQYIALKRRVAGVVLCSGVIPLEMLHSVFPNEGILEKGWPKETAVQIHYAKDDPLRLPGSVESFAAHVKEGKGTVEFFEYGGSGHLFTDKSLASEYDGANTAELYKRVIKFCTEVQAKN